MNFARRTTCNRCNTAKPDDGSGGGGGKYIFREEEHWCLGSK
jgi:hypothetical protein